MNFNEHSDRGRSIASPKGRGNPSNNATGSHRPGNSTNIYMGSSIERRPASNDRPARFTHAGGRNDTSGWNHSNQGRAQTSDNCRMGIRDPQMTDTQNQTGYSRDDALATTIEPLIRSFEKLITRLSRTNQSSEKSKRVLQG